jgi:hypothetical protein
MNILGNEKLSVGIAPDKIRKVASEHKPSALSVGRRTSFYIL